MRAGSRRGQTGVDDARPDGQADQAAAAAPSEEFWRCLQRRLTLPPFGDPAMATIPAAGLDQDLARRFAAVLGMALVGWILLVPEDQAAIRRSRLYNRYRLAGGWRWAVRLRQAGIETVCLKGLGTAASTYPIAELRTMADADLLVRPEALGSALHFLQQEGFVFGTEPTRSPWGYIGDASAEPLVSPEGVNLDLHQHPDSWPLHLGLSTEELFSESRECETPEGNILVPKTEHQILVAASNAARDLFEAPSLKLVIDGAFLLQSPANAGPAALRGRETGRAGIDWDELGVRARRGDSLRALRAYLTLLTELGLAPATLPKDLLLQGKGAGPRLLSRIADGMRAANFGDLDQEIGQREKLYRELLLAASARTILRRNLQRLAGLLRPSKGVLHDVR